MGKGSKRRPESRLGAFAEGHDAIDWSKGRPVKARIGGKDYDLKPYQLTPPNIEAMGDLAGFHEMARRAVGLTKEQEAELRDWDVTTGDGLEGQP